MIRELATVERRFRSPPAPLLAVTHMSIDRFDLAPLGLVTQDAGRPLRAQDAGRPLRVKTPADPSGLKTPADPSGLVPEVKQIEQLTSEVTRLYDPTGFIPVVKEIARLRALAGDPALQSPSPPTQGRWGRILSAVCG